ncbi:MAG: cytochrome c biogenesis protein CcdA [SAR202 cluster bacterium]|nr:cytochrome c biogenesis protein CcdA [SAR202 cluster bacterium]
MDAITIPAGNGRLLKGVLVPALVAAASLAVAVVGAFLVRDATGIDGVNGFVETLSGQSGSFIGGLGILAPLGFAFGAGLAAAFNPCGFAMLPAYMGLYMGTGDEGEGTYPVKQLGRALLVGGAVTAGFVVLFGIAGIVGIGARSVVGDVLPWLGLVIGVILAIVGAWVVGGGKLYTAFAQQAATRIGDPGKNNVSGYFLFGVSYGVASLSCTLPIFLAVVGTTFAVSSILTSLSQFVLYALGMGLIIVALTLGMAIFQSAMVRLLRRALPYIQPVGAWLMVVAGAYITFYWLSLGGLLDRLA